MWSHSNHNHPSNILINGDSVKKLRLAKVQKISRGSDFSRQNHLRLPTDKLLKMSFQGIVSKEKKRDNEQKPFQRIPLKANVELPRQTKEYSFGCGKITLLTSAERSFKRARAKTKSGFSISNCHGYHLLLGDVGFIEIHLDVFVSINLLKFFHRLADFFVPLDLLVPMADWPWILLEL